MTSVNGTVSKDFDFKNLKCSLNNPERLTRGAWSVYAYDRVYAGDSTGGERQWSAAGHGTVGTKTGVAVPDSTTSCAGVAAISPFNFDSTQITSFINDAQQAQCYAQWCSSDSGSPSNCSDIDTMGNPIVMTSGVNYVHWLHTDASTSTRFQIGSLDSSSNSRGFFMGSLSCCNSASGKDRTDVSDPPSTVHHVAALLENHLAALLRAAHVVLSPYLALLDVVALVQGAETPSQTRAKASASAGPTAFVSHAARIKQISSPFPKTSAPIASLSAKLRHFPSRVSHGSNNASFNPRQ